MSWNYHFDGLTQSFIKKFLTCRRQCYLEYVEKWTPRHIPLAFNFGKCVHHVLEHVYRHNTCPETLQIEILVNEYKQIITNDNLTLAEFNENETICELAKAILKFYFLRYSGDFKNWHFLKTEKVFKVPFLDTFITGCFDGLFENESGELCLIDHKCLSYITEEDIIASLPFDTQVQLYCYAARKLYKRPIKKIYYNIIRRPGEKQGQKTVEKFIAYVSEKIMLDPNHYFLRLPQNGLSISPAENDEWIKNQLTPIYKEIKAWQDSGFSSYVNEVNLVTKYGRCAMFNAITMNNFLGLYQRESVFHELL